MAEQIGPITHESDLIEVQSSFSSEGISTPKVSDLMAKTQREIGARLQLNKLPNDSIMRGMIEKGLPAQIRFVQYHDRLFEKKPALAALALCPLQIGALQDFSRVAKSKEPSSRAEESSESDSQDTKPLDLDTSVQYIPDGDVE